MELPRMILYYNSQTMFYFVTNFEEKECDFERLRIYVNHFYCSWMMRVSFVLYTYGQLIQRVYIVVLVCMDVERNHKKAVMQMYVNFTLLKTVCAHTLWVKKIEQIF